MKNKKNSTRLFTASRCLKLNSSSTLSDFEQNLKYGDDQFLYTHKHHETLIGKFAKLKYGNDLELIFNIDCQIQNAFDYFRKNCREIIREGQVIDLVNLNGDSMNLRENMTEFCSNKLEPRHTYILVEVTTSEFRSHTTDKIQALLYNSELLTKEFLNKVSQYSKNTMNKLIVKTDYKIVNNRNKNLAQSSSFKSNRRGTLI